MIFKNSYSVINVENQILFIVVKNTFQVLEEDENLVIYFIEYKVEGSAEISKYMGGGELFTGG